MSENALYMPLSRMHHYCWIPTSEYLSDPHYTQRCVRKWCNIDTFLTSCVMHQTLLTYASWCMTHQLAILSKLHHDAMKIVKIICILLFLEDYARTLQRRRTLQSHPKALQSQVKLVTCKCPNRTLKNKISDENWWDYNQQSHASRLRLQSFWWDCILLYPPGRDLDATSTVFE